MTRRGGCWLTSSDHVLTDEVPAPPDEVRDFYCDLDNITRVHPLVVSVQVTGRDQNENSHSETYRVRDRIPLGPFTFSVTYTACVHVPSRGEVLTEAWQFPHIRLDGRVSFEEGGLGTRVTERLRITAPRPLAAMTARKAVKAHVEMLAGIRGYFR